MQESRDAAFDRGLAMRKKIAGDVPPPPGLDEDLRGLILRYAFGDVWSRPGLDVDTRRLLTLSMTLAGGHLEEFKLHLRFAVTNGVDRATVKELILHSAVYCGIPAALDAFRAANEIYAELDAA
ncbi:MULTISPECIES: carboxymuconolactone decarboxylase family protein [unclassified Sphingopyxis]|jgi:4-carboxymuconolactone decarboxylase|uniref:carboxymuconolactone decarboxylase family protein n=1 Tax=Sphingopyxis sp. DBS4 TaxID=2968500 RepID=UPI00214C21E9|nr:carboxymuconolactone decarboxylase family protein [Sphingopyxis sp. DBS4]